MKSSWKIAVGAALLAGNTMACRDAPVPSATKTAPVPMKDFTGDGSALFAETFVKQAQEVTRRRQEANEQWLQELERKMAKEREAIAVLRQKHTPFIRVFDFAKEVLAEEEKKGNLTFQIPGIERETSTATASLRPSGGDKGKARKAAQKP